MSKLRFPLIYSELSALPIGSHVFPAQKYRCVRTRLLASGLVDESDFISAGQCTDDDVLLVHTKLWVEKLKAGKLSAREELELEVPYSPELVQSFWCMAGGSITAAEQALKKNCAVHIGGGFHHAFSDHGEGFCVINDVAIAIRRMQQTGKVVRAMVLDCDVHQGNGTASIFGDGEPEPFPREAWSASLTQPKRPASVKHGPSRDVFTISLHQENNYPVWKPASSIDVNLPDGTTDDEYLQWLRSALHTALERFEPELICYIAGADPYLDDQLGGLALTIDGLKQRDRMVFEFAYDNGFPIMTTFAGGYAQNLQDTVTIHANTVLAAREVFG